MLHADGCCQRFKEAIFLNRVPSILCSEELLGKQLLSTFAKRLLPGNNLWTAAGRKIVDISC